LTIILHGGDRFGEDSNSDDFVSSAKDQLVQGPCAAFAATALLEAAIQIYFNTPISETEINLSEQFIYSSCNYPDASPGALSAVNALDIIKNNGIGEESCFPYPEDFICVSAGSCSDSVACGTCTGSDVCCKDITLYYGDCSDLENCSENASFPFYDTYTNLSASTLKELIIDRGPVMAYIPQFELHSETLGHSILIIGWQVIDNELNWIIKNSWPGENDIVLVSDDYILESSGTKSFYAVRYAYGANKLSCNTFSENERECVDEDGDGFCYWGIGDRPTGCTGPCQMDFNDADSTTIFLDANYEPVSAPSVSGPDLVCTSGGTFSLNDLPSGFTTVTWSVSDPTYFNSSTSGTGTSATVYPKSQYSGDPSYITFTISDGCGSAQYRKYFSINGPADSEIDINVVPSSAPNPIRVSGIWMLCPNSTYYIYCNNTSGCSLSNYQWTIPAGWTKYEQSSNYIRINTNSSPFGTVTVNATTCCGTSHPVITQNFSQGGPCSYYSVYPNPVTTELTIEFENEFDMNTVDATTTLEIYDSGFTKKYKAEKIEKKMKIKTSNWKEGFYNVILEYQGQKYYEKIKVGK